MATCVISATEANVLPASVKGRDDSQINLVRRAQAGDDAILADGRNAQPQHYLGVGAETVQGQDQQSLLPHGRRHVQQVGDVQIHPDRFHI